MSLSCPRWNLGILGLIFLVGCVAPTNTTKDNARPGAAKAPVLSAAVRQKVASEAMPNSSGSVRPMVTANVIHRVFRIRFGQQIGTGFAIDVDKRQYLVTAKHIVGSLVGQGELGLFASGTWSAIPVQLVGHAVNADISVLATDRRLTPDDLPLESIDDGIVYSQDVFFLGFPYDILSQFVFEADGYPLPLVKKAIVSSFVERGLYLLDGHNNPGFSGGPVVFVRAGERDFKVAAVISGFRAVEEPIFAGNQKTPLVYRYNTGIIVAYSIEHATALIRSNPIGFRL